MDILRKLKFFTILWLSFSSVTTAHAILVDRIAGVVDGEVITYSDLEIERIFNLSEGKDREVLQLLIDRRLLLKEAEKFRIAESEEDLKKVQERLQDIKTKTGEEQVKKLLSEYSLTEQGILKKLMDKVLEEKFISFRINFFVVISDASIKAYYNEHKDEFGDNGLEAVHNQIKEKLFRIEAKGKLEDYLKQLRKKAKVSVNL